MTNIVIAGVTPASLHFLRYTLGLPTMEVVALVTTGPGEDLTYGFVSDSASSRFRGTATYDADALVLAGRYGRGGLRHDQIALYDTLDAALNGHREVDCLVLAEGWPVPQDLPVSTVIRLDTDVPDPVSEIVARVTEALTGLTPVTHAFISTSGAANPGDTGRERLLAQRGNRAGSAARMVEASGTLAMEVIRPMADRVLVTTVFLVFTEPVTEGAVRRCLRSAGRRELASCIQLESGPIGTSDVVGSPNGVLDLGTVQVAGDAVSFSFLVDPLAVRTRLACELASSPGGATR